MEEKNSREKNFTLVGIVACLFIFATIAIQLLTEGPSFIYQLAVLLTTIASFGALYAGLKAKQGIAWIWLLTGGIWLTLLLQTMNIF